MQGGIDMEIGKKLKKARLKAGFTQEVIANEIHVSRQTISNWENEKNYPDIVSIINLSDLYKISLDELLKGDDAVIKHLEDSTNVVKSNKRLTIGMITLMTFLVSLRIADKYYFKFPRIGGLWQNILVMVISFGGIIWYVLRHTKISDYIASYIKNKNIYMALFCLLYIGSIFSTFHLISILVNETRVIFVLRGISAVTLGILVSLGYKLAVQSLD